MLPKKKIPNANENFSDENFLTLTAEESVHFKNEIDKQLSETKIIDIVKAAKNAKYLAMLDRGFDDTEGVTMTFEELERFIDEGCNISR